MSDYSEYFLNSKANIVLLECLEISHPNFSKIYYVVRNATLGVTVTHEDSTVHDYAYYPLKIEKNSVTDNLDVAFNITLGDLGDIIPKELDAVEAANGFGTKPQVIYRAYRSDDLLLPLYGPLFLQITNFANTREGSTFTAEAPRLNVNQTGEVYTVDRFPMLRGFVYG